MTTDINKIIYTITDEAPALVTYSLLPIVRAFAKAANIVIETKDISLSSRIIAKFPENLTVEQRQSDALSELGELVKTPQANIIKLPNISASTYQLIHAIKELQSHGYDIPDFPEQPKTIEEKNIKVRYTKILGSAVNPILRVGNSNRQVATVVKKYAQKNPLSMKAWSANSQSHVAHMERGDFYSSEQSAVMSTATDVKIEFVDKDGQVTVLKNKQSLLAGEIIDSAVMHTNSLRDFFEQSAQEAKNQGVLLSLHLKSTMMKVSDPVIFGHAVMIYFKDVFAKYDSIFSALGVNPNNGLSDIYAKIDSLPVKQQKAVRADILAVYKLRPPLAMVPSDKNNTNLHVPNDIIIDTSMAAVLRSAGQMLGPDGKLHDTKAMIPDRCYAGVYQEVIDFCKKNGAFNVSTMGNVSNIGLMAQQAEEYGSHENTFLAPADGVIRVVNKFSRTIFEHCVEKDDIWRMCQTKDIPIRDWVNLSVTRARATAALTVFWLDKNRAHDVKLIAKVNKYLKFYDTESLDIRILSPIEACRLSMETIKSGQNIISVTGNVLRDYLTDLFPILELGTSAKMLSIVSLLTGGSLFETGAGGSAPKHVQQFITENHLRWDSLGEFLAIAMSLKEIAIKNNNSKAKVLSEALNVAIAKYLDANKSPSIRVKELDNRGSHYFLAQYWAKAMVAQNQDHALSAHFVDLAKVLVEKESFIIHELNAAQGAAVDLGGYYHPTPEKVMAVMRPSSIFNAAIDDSLLGKVTN